MTSQKPKGNSSSASAIFIGYVVPEEEAKKVFALDPLPQIQTHRFGWSLFRAVSSSGISVTLISSYPVQSYPIVKKLTFPGRKVCIEGSHCHLLGFANVIVAKHATRLISGLRAIHSLDKPRTGEWVLLHGLHSPYVIVALARKLTAGARLCVVLTDPPGIALPTDGFVARRLKSLDILLLSFLLRWFDATVTLSPFIAERLMPQKPALVLPGILNNDTEKLIGSMSHEVQPTRTSRPYTIMYAGTLARAYGVDLLLDAVQTIQSESDFVCEFYGRGDMEKEISAVARRDRRVRLMGFVDPELLLPKLCQADLLINPRPSHTAIATDSFPSKLVEYLATGRPVLTTRVKTIPTELQGFFNFIDCETSAGIAASISNVMGQSVQQLEQQARRGKRYVFDNMNEAACGRRISAFLSSLSGSECQ